MPRSFQHNGQTWTAESTGQAHGFGVGEKLPAIDRFEVRFACPADGTKKHGWISRPNADDATENELQNALLNALET